ncbi:metal-sensing transcriptional repressor [Candidatus Uhrbacteria bacterium]|nr:metal-sensing transcriptional repressor [Candidatus Uhrbacteria bacterium]
MKQDATKRAIHRVRILKGLMGKLEAGIQDKSYCVDLLNQSLAIQKALKSLDAHLLDQHLNSCVKSHMTKGSKSEHLREELLKIYKLSRKNS